MLMVSLANDDFIKSFLICTWVSGPNPRLVLGGMEVNIHNPCPLRVQSLVAKIEYQSTIIIQASK